MYTNRWYSAEYWSFKIGDELNTKYRLEVAGYSSTLSIAWKWLGTAETLATHSNIQAKHRLFALSQPALHAHHGLRAITTNVMKYSVVSVCSVSVRWAYQWVMQKRTSRSRCCFFLGADVRALKWPCVRWMCTSPPPEEYDGMIRAAAAMQAAATIIVVWCLFV